jgi:hypothetical protein
MPRRRLAILSSGYPLRVPQRWTAVNKEQLYRFSRRPELKVK